MPPAWPPGGAHFATGTTREQVAQAVWTSAERALQGRAYYHAFLGRDLDAVGAGLLEQSLRRRGDRERRDPGDSRLGRVPGPAPQQRRLRPGGLPRAAGPHGRCLRGRLLVGSAGCGRGQGAGGRTRSPARRRLTSGVVLDALYVGYLNHTPDASAQGFWMEPMNANAWSDADVALIVLSSDEFNLVAESPHVSVLPSHFSLTRRAHRIVSPAGFTARMARGGLGRHVQNRLRGMKPWELALRGPDRLARGAVRRDNLVESLSHPRATENHHDHPCTPSLRLLIVDDDEELRDTLVAASSASAQPSRRRAARGGAGQGRTARSTWPCSTCTCRA